MARRTPQRRSVERRAAILEAARQLMTSEGMKAVSHRRVADAAGVPIGSVGYYFSAREELLMQCLAADDEDRAREARRAREGAAPELEPEEVGARVIRTVWGESSGDLVGRVGAAMDGVRESPLLRERVRESRSALDADLAELLIACGYSPRLAEFALDVGNGSIVNSGVEGHAADAFARAARDVGALLELVGRG
ncbi:MAG: TetR/AcrR family transcriptional regulator [Brachybacterium sp.]